MKDFTEMSDLELLLSVGSSRPSNDGLAKLAGMYSSHGELEQAQERFDKAVEEMHRRDSDGGFLYRIPQ